MNVLPAVVSQSNATAGGDIVGGNKTTVHNYPIVASRVEALMVGLAKEIESKQEVQGIIDSLQFYFKQIAPDGIAGLEAKLTHAGRSGELYIAFEKKELFVKLLDKYSLYESAQKIFAYLLAKVEHEFNFTVHPQVTHCDVLQINQLISTKIVEPIVAECGVGPLDVNHNVAMGMVYWLAEQCFVRWH
ncbi:ABC-three component system protein [Sinorhizobium fredii]|uniref:ABC-three component system protein n=2 Tax=Rhizobium fredii TaxID=380 RepID=UPI003391B65D